MIYDTTENADQYRGISSNLDKALDFIKSCTPDITEGRHEIDGEKVFALVSNYQSKHQQESSPEAHVRYIDLQMVLSGEEFLICGFLKDARKKLSGDPDKDIAFYEADGIPLPLSPGKFAVLFPADLHQPGIRVHEPAPVKKLVIKIEMQQKSMV
ncbi:YhcH/YjgK/YiaL family protein [Breznakiella homolactica]|uniref:YhcH/YjgK/YiaL family protein n=1 Tax=Breznakiella homolactica TaxID=2798577 RepID=A0A7T8BBT7_9SPIR|nr:YhcH/YjgK/YiaL family protein [Breznakiella homolactica]QQO09543.1 YhcH/YjgK/YiaL family protein [Breznakiella homolactica]